MPAKVHRPAVILFIEEQRAAVALNWLVTTHGLPVTWVRSDEEFLEVVAHGKHVAVVTRTHNIGKVCRRARTNVINIEKFAFKTIEHADEADTQWSFDHEAFIEYLKTVVHCSAETLYPDRECGSR